MKEWAKREIRIAKERENNDEYANACYDSALKAFESLLADDHSGMSIMITKNILNRLIEGKVLTPIEDTPDIWNELAYRTSDCIKTAYQCKRMSSLFKYVLEDGSVVYSDMNRFYGDDINSHITYHSKLLEDIVEAKYPIKMPYYPPSIPYRIYTDEFCYMRPDVVGSYTHTAILYMITPDGEKEDIDKYYAESENGEMVEISKEQYYADKRETFGEL